MSANPDKPAANPVTKPSETAAATDGVKGPGVADRLKPVVQPFGKWLWLNLRIWGPFLANPEFRACTVKFTPKDGREADTWVLSLPHQCWKCGEEKGLISRQYQFSVRFFESPMGIVAVALGLAVFTLLVGWFFTDIWGFLKVAAVALLIVAVGAAMIFVKSWTEPVHLTIWTSPEHADELRRPDAAAFDGDLYLVLANAEHAKAAKAEAAAKRRTTGKYAADSKPTVDPSFRSTSEPTRPASPAQPYKRDELPPIRLDE